MGRPKRIFFVTDTKDLTEKLLLEGLRKQVKGFIRLGHDTQVFSFNHAMAQVCSLRGRVFRGIRKGRVDELLAQRLRDYQPDVVIVAFAKYLDGRTVERARGAVAGAVFVGTDVDLWPELHKSRVEAARGLDVVTTTYGSNGQQGLKDAGIRCVFLPNMCDPDIEHRYEVAEQWKSDILFTGKLVHRHYPTEDVRREIISRLAERKGCALYGCCGRRQLGGIEYMYAISGAKTALSINAVNDIRMYHSDRLTQYLACGTLVLAKWVPDSELLFEDKVHLRYFHTCEEFFELADWYLKHEEERSKIANAGMEYVHREFNCVKIAGYMLNCVEKGFYKAPWMP